MDHSDGAQHGTSSAILRSLWASSDIAKGIQETSKGLF